ncbi:hypothetical protein [Mesorhizobium sp. M1A.F.Ca.ET.072.01.1.1]|uniref:hypothetical protein n=1 Tax=Mesorhizobium sp. M1A.F.Ca.ET.072.01.1.1 TaxID=2496753 RepID=UPI0016773537|nr:hypothetical protein [Mesorhizobium sp. M1A.F.Ca.ET.072.01.1.1]
MAEINRSMGGWQAGKPCQDGFDDDAHKSTSQPHSLACVSTTAAASEVKALDARTIVDLSRMVISPEHPNSAI